VFSEHFSFSSPARVNFVGGGGKTSLILILLDEYAATSPVLYTTTTRIHPPHPAEGMVVISSNNESYLEALLERAVFGWCCGRKFVVTRLGVSPNLLQGLDPGFLDRLDEALFPVILIEADGARSMSLKFPRENEPVLAGQGNYLVPVIGLDCLNKPLGPGILFRWELACRRLGLKEKQRLTPELAAAILLHPQGVCKDWHPGMQIVPFINKVDSAADEAPAQLLAAAFLRNGNFPIHRVVWGSTREGRAGAFAA
jgi:probable selenium-dependent hydroxylase accessory protein YqeC